MNYLKNLNKDYENFKLKVMGNIDNLASSKKQCIQGTSQDRFDAEITEKLIKKDRPLFFIKTSYLHVDKDKEWKE